MDSILLAPTDGCYWHAQPRSGHDFIGLHDTDCTSNAESAKSPYYLVELWTSQKGQIDFTSIGTLDSTLTTADEAGYSRPSRGRVFPSEVDGDDGPSEVPWPKPLQLQEVRSLDTRAEFKGSPDIWRRDQMEVRPKQKNWTRTEWKTIARGELRYP